MEGIIYLLNQSGVALAQAEQQIAALSKRIKELESDSSEDKSESRLAAVPK